MLSDTNPKEETLERRSAPDVAEVLEDRENIERLNTDYVREFPRFLDIIYPYVEQWAGNITLKDKDFVGLEDTEFSKSSMAGNARYVDRRKSEIWNSRTSRAKDAGDRAKSDELKEAKLYNYWVTEGRLETVAEEAEKGENEKIENNSKIAKLAEYCFARWMRKIQIPGLRLGASIAAEIDDFANGVDVVGIAIPTSGLTDENQSYTPFALDITTGGSEMNIRKKFAKHKKTGHNLMVSQDADEEEQVGATCILRFSNEAANSSEITRCALYNVPQFKVGVSEESLKKLFYLQHKKYDDTEVDRARQREITLLSKRIRFATIAEIAVQARALKRYHAEYEANEELKQRVDALDHDFAEAFAQIYNDKLADEMFADDVWFGITAGVAEYYGFDANDLDDYLENVKASHVKIVQDKIGAKGLHVTNSNG